MAQSKAAQISGWQHVYSGKVRDLYSPQDEDSQDAELVLMVATDRISAYDHILPTLIPGKGVVLTQLSLWWFEKLQGLVPTQVVSSEVPEMVSGRGVICRRLKMFPVECVVRGYLTGSGLAEYRETGQVCGIELPEGLTEGSPLPTPIFTPAIKAAVGEHDQNATFEEVVELVGKQAAHDLRDTSLAVYRHAARIALEAGIILADTKFEFGTALGSSKLVLADEVLTPDSSRFWPLDSWVEGQSTPSFDKQYVRDWLTSPASGWDRNSSAPPPELPADVVKATQQRYLEAYELLTNRTLNV